MHASLPTGSAVPALVDRSGDPLVAPSPSAWMIGFASNAHSTSGLRPTDMSGEPVICAPCSVFCEPPGERSERDGDRDELVVAEEAGGGLDRPVRLVERELVADEIVDPRIGVEL